MCGRGKMGLGCVGRGWGETLGGGKAGLRVLRNNLSLSKVKRQSVCHRIALQLNLKEFQEFTLNMQDIVIVNNGATKH